MLVAFVALIGARLAYGAAEYQEQRVAALLVTAALLQEHAGGGARLLPDPERDGVCR